MLPIWIYFGWLHATAFQAPSDGNKAALCSASLQAHRKILKEDSELPGAVAVQDGSKKSKSLPSGFCQIDAGQVGLAGLAHRTPSRCTTQLNEWPVGMMGNE